MNYAVEQRMRFIDFALHHYGHIDRKILQDFFGVGEATATRDFRKYRELAPENMVLNQPDKCYYRTKSFKRVYG